MGFEARQGVYDDGNFPKPGFPRLAFFVSDAACY
jgi:hypothetical protein